MNDDEIFSAFLNEAKKLMSYDKLDAVKLDLSARHLSYILKLQKAKVVFADNISGSHLEGMKTTGQYMTKDFGYHNLIKIDIRQKKNEMIKTFIHEMFHQLQHNNLEKFKEAINKGTFEKDAYAFSDKIMKKLSD
jgi:anti-sigma28 factor (negative regulator of flagellin synthesis)